MPFADDAGVVPLDAAAVVEGLKENPPNPPEPVLAELVLAPPKLNDGVDVLPNPPKAGAGLVAADEADGAALDGAPEPPKLKVGAELLPRVGVLLGLALPKEKPVPAPNGFEADTPVLSLVEPPLLPKLNAVEADFGDVAAPDPKETVLGGVGGVGLDVEAEAGAVPKENPANGFGGAAAAASFLSVPDAVLDDDDSLTVSTCLNGDGCRARLVPPGMKACALFDIELVVEEDGWPGSAEAFLSDPLAALACDGKANVLFSSLLSTLDGLNTKPPAEGALDVSALLATSFDASGLNELPAKVKAAGGAGGLGESSFFDEEGVTLVVLSESASFVGLLSDAGAAKEKPAKGFGGAAAGADSLGAGVEAADALGCGANAKPVEGVDVALTAPLEAEDVDCAPPKLKAGLAAVVPLVRLLEPDGSVDEPVPFLCDSIFCFSFL